MEKSIFENLKKAFELMKSVKVEETENGYDIIALKYRSGAKYNGASSSQVNYLMGMTNVHFGSNNTLRKLNKWAASKIIDVAKMYPEVSFNISTVSRF